MLIWPCHLWQARALHNGAHRGLAMGGLNIPCASCLPTPEQCGLFNSCSAAPADLTFAPSLVYFCTLAPRPLDSYSRAEGRCGEQCCYSISVYVHYKLLYHYIMSCYDYKERLNSSIQEKAESGQIFILEHLKIGYRSCSGSDAADDID